MAINLLPDEQKIKIKKLKSEAIAPTIELTGPEKVIKKKPGIKKAGVLTFFKKAFVKPKKDIRQEEDKGVLVERQKKEKPAVGPKPKVEFYSIEPEPSQIKIKSGPSVGSKIAGLFSAFSRKKKDKQKSKPEPKEKPAALPEDKFPKYKPVSTEKVKRLTEVKPRKSEVIKLSTKPAPTSKPKKQGPSVWQKVISWFKNLLKSRPKTVKPVPHAREFKKEKDVPVEKVKILFEEKKSPLPKPSEKPLPSSPAEPLPHYKEKAEEKETPEFVPPGLPPVPKPTEKKPVPKPVEKVVIIEEEKQRLSAKKVKPELIPSKKEKPKTEKRFRLSAWLKKVWQAFKELFKRKKKALVTATAAPVQPSPKPTVKADEKLVLISEEKSAIEPSKPPVPPASVSAQIHEDKISEIELPEKTDTEKPREVSVPPPPAEEKVKEMALPVPASPTSHEAKGIALTNPELPIKGRSGLDWEVNLIPEEAREKELTTSKIVILILSVIGAIVFVIGGWGYSEWYYNRISVTISEVEQSISEVNLNILGYQNLQNRAELLKKQIEDIQALMDNHIYWSELFNKLETYTTADVYYDSMTVDVNGAVSLLAHGRNYESAIRQLLVFERAVDFVDTATIENISFEAQSEEVANEETEVLETDDKTVIFTISLLIDPDIFYYPRTD